MPPLKLISHNKLRKASEGGETAFIKAAQMDIDLVRYDFRWHHLVKQGGYEWAAAGPNDWVDKLEPALRWTKAHGMRTLVNLLAYNPPDHARNAMKSAWEAHSGGASDDPRKLALWAGWATENGVPPGGPSPKDFTEALLDRLAAGQAAGDWDVVGFCVLNEPNTRWPGEPNWKRIRVGGGTYDTADYCRALLGWVKGHIAAAHSATLGHTVTVVNPYPFWGHWFAREWRQVAADPNLDVLGIDIYWDQLFGLLAWGKARAMGRLSAEHSKPWWLVETAGAPNPNRLWKNPSCRRVKAVSDLSVANGAQVLGYYRLWGDYGGWLDYAAAYNVFTNPGSSSTPTTDGSQNAYWETIRDV